MKITHNTRVPRSFVATRWGKPNLKKKQMLPLTDARWQWEDGMVPCYTVPIIDVVLAELQPSFADWLRSRGGVSPTESIESQLRQWLR